MGNCDTRYTVLVCKIPHPGTGGHRHHKIRSMIQKQQRSLPKITF